MDVITRTALPLHQDEQDKTELRSLKSMKRGEGFGIGTGGHRSVLKSHKTRQVPAESPSNHCRSMAKASSWARGRLWDRDRGPSVSFEIP